MKRTFIAAASLLLGTSALAAASAAQDKFDKSADMSVASKLMTGAIAKSDFAMTKTAKSAAANGSADLAMGSPLEELDGKATGKTQYAQKAADFGFAKNERAMAMKSVSAGMGGPLEPVDASAKPLMADASYWDDPIIAAKHSEAAALKGGMGGPLETVDDSAKPIMADASYWDDPIIAAKHSEAAALKGGLGGPLEEAKTASLDLGPRAAADNYPPCSPGPGDDRCIQLYEPGVRAQLASWNQGTGGLADGKVATGMGGPYEPVDLALNNEMAADHDLAAVKPDDNVELAQHSEFSGMGGPIEAQSGYPACSPGPGDDRCIQLYEPGVTGAGN